jgi:hypothetical protein
MRKRHDTAQVVRRGMTLGTGARGYPRPAKKQLLDISSARREGPESAACGAPSGTTCEAGQRGASMRQRAGSVAAGKGRGRGCSGRRKNA